MAELYHCFYKEPVGEAILASCFREVNGQEKSYLFAATHLTKALAFAFSYHDEEVILNSGVTGSENELVLICGGQETLEKARHIRVFGFPDDGFTLIPRARQAVSENPMPFSQARLVMETTDYRDLMKAGLQIFLLPEKCAFYMDENGSNFKGNILWDESKTNGEAMGKIMRAFGGRWINQEQGVNVCPVLAADITSPSSSPGQQPQARPVLPSP